MCYGQQPKAWALVICPLFTKTGSHLNTCQLNLTVQFTHERFKNMLINLTLTLIIFFAFLLLRLSTSLEQRALSSTSVKTYKFKI